MTKKELVKKIAKEQNLNAKKLERMSIEELQKMDLVVPDADLLGGDTASEEAQGVQETSTEPTGTSDIDNGNELGQSVPSENGTDIVTPPESPSEKPEVQAKADASDVSTTDDSGSRGPLLGYHPVSELPVYQNEQ